MEREKGLMILEEKDLGKTIRINGGS